MKPYIKNPKGICGGKFGPTEQDQEDFEQEKLIQNWLKERGDQIAIDRFDFKSINSKGNPRNIGIAASIRLDQKIQEDGSSTFADIIAGSDGRDLECGADIVDNERDAKEKISWYLSALNFKGEMKEWLEKTLRLSALTNNLPCEKSQIDSESWIQFEHFST